MKTVIQSELILLIIDIVKGTIKVWYDMCTVKYKLRWKTWTVTVRLIKPGFWDGWLYVKYFPYDYKKTVHWGLDIGSTDTEAASVTVQERVSVSVLYG